MIVAREEYSTLRPEGQEMYDAPCVDECVLSDTAECEAKDIENKQLSLPDDTTVRTYDRICGKRSYSQSSSQCHSFEFHNQPLG